MKISQLKTTLTVCAKLRRPVFIWGEKGLGKTQTVRQWAEENGYNYIPLYLGPMADTSDILGIQEKRPDGTFFHTRPDWFPTEGRNIIHLDEFNRCHPDLVQSMLSFVQLGSFHQHKVPENTFFVGTGNTDNERYITTSITDDALLGRFVHVELKPEVEEWLHYAENNNCSPTVLGFIRQNPEKLIRQHKDGGFDFNILSEDPRHWLESISPFESVKEIEDFRYELYSGIVGRTMAASFIEFRRKAEAVLDYKKVLTNYDEVRPAVVTFSSRDASRLDQLNQVLESILMRMDQNEIMEMNHVENFKRFLMDVPLELAFKASARLMKSKFKLKDLIINDTIFLKKFKTIKEGEK